jgi:Spy/CpxP family protein refolding chaperone
MRTVIMLALLVAASVAAPAQPPRNFSPWWDNPVVGDLNLTAGQREHVRGIVREYRSRLAQQRAAVLKAEDDLNTALNQDTVDTQKALEAARNLGNARRDLTTSFAEMSVRLREQLTADQWKELQKRRGQRPLGGVTQWRQLRRGAPASPPQQ